MSESQSTPLGPNESSKRRRKGGSKRPFSVVAIDLETTGLSEDDDDITEIAGIRFTLQGDRIDTFQRLAKPCLSIPKKIEKLTGITNEMVDGAPTSWEVIQEFSEWLGPEPLLVAHNASFDAKFIAACYSRNGQSPPSWQIIDTLSWARGQNLPVSDYKLSTLLTHIDKDQGDLHRALADAAGVVELTLFLCSTVKDGKRAIKRRAKSLAEIQSVPQIGLYKKPKQKGDWDDRPATEKQLAYLRDLGASEKELSDITIQEASDLITEYKDGEGGEDGCVEKGCGAMAFAVVLIIVFLLMSKC